MSLSDMRKSYEKGTLEESSAHQDPLAQFSLWLEEAIKAQIPEPNAMTLATVGSDLKPSTRVVLIKDYDEKGIVWYSHYNSRKGLELSGNPYAALQFHWVSLERVVRIEGCVHHISAQESDAYFASRPIDSRLGAWASPQSQVIEHRAQLLKRASEAAARFQFSPPRPEHWGGFRLVPHQWEFWQGRKSRLHDRLRYQFNASQQRWLIERLAP